MNLLLIIPCIKYTILNCVRNIQESVFILNNKNLKIYLTNSNTNKLSNINNRKAQLRLRFLRFFKYNSE